MPRSHAGGEITTRNLYDSVLLLPGFEKHPAGSVGESANSSPDDRCGGWIDECSGDPGPDDGSSYGGGNDDAGNRGCDGECAGCRDGCQGGSVDDGRAEPGLYGVGYGQLRGDQLGE